MFLFHTLWRFLMKDLNKQIHTLILDVDGVITDGRFFYDLNGRKVLKCFGPDDSDALKLISKRINVIFVSADRRGFAISKARVEDMGYEIFNISSNDRLDWIKSKFDITNSCYIGDGFYDSFILKQCAYSITMSGSSIASTLVSNYVTSSPGGNRGVSEAILHLCAVFFPDLFEEYCNKCHLNKTQSDLLYRSVIGTKLSTRALTYINYLNNRAVDKVLAMLSSKCVLQEPNKIVEGIDNLREEYHRLCSLDGLLIDVMNFADSHDSVWLHLRVMAKNIDTEVVDIIKFDKESQISSIKAIF